jgi:hypothetical protein
LYTVHQGCTYPGHRLALAFVICTVGPNILVPSNETCYMTLFWRLVYYSGFQSFKNLYTPAIHVAFPYQCVYLQ